MQSTTFDVDHLAELARMQLTVEERERFSQELPRILEYVDQLQELETTGVAETAQVTGLTDVLRADEPEIIALASLRDRRAALLGNAPATDASFIQVPAILIED
jgi:aspartyl-tRNA(Asn)/glutamyl-tRNA(Gln) amidotransferase subunit C